MGLSQLLTGNTSSMEGENRFSYLCLFPSVDKEVGPGLLERNLVSASCDSSDGLLRTLEELCDASGGLGVTVWGDRIPISHGLWPPDSSDVDIHRPLPPLDVLQNVFCGGEEFHHVFCVPPEHLDEVLSLFPQGRLTHIGFMTPREKGCRIQSSQDENCSLFFEQLGDTGFTHFSGRDGNCT